MKVICSIILSVFISLPAFSQIIIDGKITGRDDTTSCFLATVPETYFNKPVDLNVQLEEGWQLCMIDGKILPGILHLDRLNAQKKYAVTLASNKGVIVNGHLQFTFLPIIQLQGEFGYNYQDGLFLFSDPSANHTDTLTAHIKWRGNTSNTEDKHKRNYRVKFTDDHSFLGMRKDNNWLLDAGQPDLFRLRNLVAWDIWNDLGSQPYYADREPKARLGVTGKVVEVFLDNKYRGIYNFMENMDRKQLKLKKADKQTGEVHGCLYKTEGYIISNMADTIYHYDNHSEFLSDIEVKYPDLNDNDTTDWSTFVNAVNFVATSSDETFTEHVAEYFDLPPIIDFCVFGSVLNAIDNRGKNLFWAVYDKADDKKLTMTPWDMDCTVGQEWGALHHEVFPLPDYLPDMTWNLTWRMTLLNTQGFNDTLNVRYRQLRQGIFATDSLKNRYKAYNNLLQRSGAAQREETKWSGDSDVRGEVINFDLETAYICNWLDIHLSLLDEITFPLYVYGIDEATIPDRKEDVRQGLFTLSGQPVSNFQSLRPGIYILNGRKIVKR
jgi:hypothetical protein